MVKGSGQRDFKRWVIPTRGRSLFDHGRLLTNSQKLLIWGLFSFGDLKLA